MGGSNLSDGEIERLLSQGDPLGDEAGSLVLLVELIRADGARAPSEAMVARVAGEAAAIARSTAAVRSHTSPHQRRFAWRLQPNLAITLVMMLLLIGVSGVAVAADGAAPGDALYGVDLALEKLGIGAGEAEERLEEARALLSQGQPKDALQHATEVLDEEEMGGADIQNARKAVEDAALNLEDSDETGNVVVRDEVSEFLRYVKENLGKDVGADGREFGQGVANLARDLAPAQSEDANNDQGNGNGGANGNGNGGQDQGTGSPGSSGSAPGRQGDS
jgi:hypothetical protein